MEQLEELSGGVGRKKFAQSPECGRVVGSGQVEIYPYPNSTLRFLPISGGIFSAGKDVPEMTKAALVTAITLNIPLS